MQLTPKQKEIAKDSTRFRVVNAGRRFGKTILAVEEMIGVAVAGNDRRVAYIAPTFQQARDIAWEHLKARCQPIIAETNESQLKLTLKTSKEGTSIIQLKSWDAVETLRGQKFHFLVIDEVAMMRNFWIGWQEVLRPALTDTQGGALFISTPKGFNHFYDLYNLESTEEAFKSFHATTYDNPHIEPSEIDEAKRQIPEDQFAQEYLADFRKQEGLVYKEFDRDRHVTTGETFVFNESRGCVDFGFTNPTAMYTVRRTKDNEYFVEDEFYETGKTHDQIVQFAMLRKVRGWYPDPAEAPAIELMRRNGLQVYEVSKEVIGGIDTVRNLFLQNRLYIHPSCKNLIAELETYRYKEAQPNKNEPEEPVKENDHGLDAIRYCLHMWDSRQDRDHEDYYRKLELTQTNSRVRL